MPPTLVLKLLKLCSINNQCFPRRITINFAFVKNFDSGTGRLNCSCYKKHQGALVDKVKLLCAHASVLAWTPRQMRQFKPHL